MAMYREGRGAKMSNSKQDQDTPVRVCCNSYATTVFGRTIIFFKLKIICTNFVSCLPFTVKSVGLSKPLPRYEENNCVPFSVKSQKLHS